MTYGGWVHSRALGARIGEILRDRILAPGQPGRPFKVVIHSSPFLRCVQTSEAISSGIAADPSPLQSRGDDRRKPEAEAPKSPSATSEPIAIARGGVASPSEVSPAIHITAPSTPSLDRKENGDDKDSAFYRTVLRIDAFLGEWMSPTYFELITPPPGSVMMVAGAKAELLRKENYREYPHFQDTLMAQASSPRQLWGSAPRPGLDDLSELSGSLPTGDGATGNGEPPSRKASASAFPNLEGYAPPIPTFAVSSNAPIPAGYVAHARDACVDIDYQWDSMRGPYDWGTGGEYGEEWTAMHKRFRKGIQRLVDWYSTTEGAADMVTKAVRPNSGAAKADSDSAIDDSDGDDVESVVILVTHGAGCNALIGAITHQPVLMDVGMASLTMAVRKPGMETVVTPLSISVAKNRVATPSSAATPPLSAPHPGVVAIHEHYDLKMFANTDHMRSVTITPMASRHPSVANLLAGARGRHANSLSSALGNFSYADGGGSRSSSANAALANARRGVDLVSTSPGSGITVGSGVRSFRDAPGIKRTPSYGLWSPIRDETDPFENDSDMDLLLDFSHEKDARAKRLAEAMDSDELVLRPDEEVPPVASPSVLEAADLPPASPPQLGLGAGGLWGSPRPPAEVARLRDLGSGKRRWTVTERS